jgi:hypothetical protein
MDRLHQLISPFNFVMGKRISAHDFVVLVSDHATLLYAACRVNARRRIVTAPNYVSTAGDGVLSAEASVEGLRDVLSWTDRQTGLQRYADLITDRNPAPFATDGLTPQLVPR